MQNAGLQVNVFNVKKDEVNHIKYKILLFNMFYISHASLVVLKKQIFELIFSWTGQKLEQYLILMFSY